MCTGLEGVSAEAAVAGLDPPDGDSTAGLFAKITLAAGNGGGDCLFAGTGGGGSSFAGTGGGGCSFVGAGGGPAAAAWLAAGKGGGRRLPLGVPVLGPSFSGRGGRYVGGRTYPAQRQRGS